MHLFTPQAVVALVLAERKTGFTFGEFYAASAKIRGGHWQESSAHTALRDAQHCGWVRKRRDDAENAIYYYLTPAGESAAKAILNQIQMISSGDY